MTHYPLYPELNEWLRQHRARHIGEGRVWEQHHDLYVVNERLIIIATYSENGGQGCEIYVPVQSANGIADALKSVEVACGIKPE